jgi:hypothetical protein
VLGGEAAALPDQERRHPDAGAPTALADPPDQVAERPEPAGEVQPVADLGLVAVVDLDHLDRQVEVVHGVEVLEHVRLGDLGEVVVPGAPGGRRRPWRAEPRERGPAVGPGGQRGPEATEPAGRAVGPGPTAAVGATAGSGVTGRSRVTGHLELEVLDWAVGLDHHAPLVPLGADRRHVGAGVGCGEHVHRATVAGVDRQQPLALEAAGRRDALGPVAHHPADVTGRPVRPLLEAVGGRRRPRLPTVLIDARGVRVDLDRGDLGEPHGPLLLNPWWPPASARARTAVAGSGRRSASGSPPAARRRRSGCRR